MGWAQQPLHRAFRLGQKRKVLVHKFVCRGTLEERIDALLQDKQKLATDLLGTGTSAESLLTRMTPDELLKLATLDLTTIA